MKALEISNLQVEYKNSKGIKNIDLDIYSGEITCVVGESGCGKTTLIKSITNILEDVDISGTVYYKDKDLLKINNIEMNKLRWKQISYVFQNSLGSLNPRTKLRKQLEDVLLKAYSKKELKHKSIELMSKVGLDVDTLDLYPNQISGGMAQKFCIAMATCLDPEIIIFDEPTSSLDIDSKDNVLKIIKHLKKDGKTVIVVTHDLKLAKDYADKLVVMYGGRIVESGDARSIIKHPKHMYTKGLINSCIDLNPYKELSIIPGINNLLNTGCGFYNRCTQRIGMCKEQIPSKNKYEDRVVYCNRGGIKKLLKVNSISKSFGDKEVLDKCDLDIYFSEVISIVGKSGEGKSTLANIIAGLDNNFFGEVKLLENNKKTLDLMREYEGIQIIMQNPYDSINDSFTVYETIAEPLIINNLKCDNLLEEVKKYLKIVSLSNEEDFLYTNVKELSGGQLQRVSIVRALIMKPKILIADEITSMMDASSKSYIIKYLKNIQEQVGVSIVFITHDLALAKRVSDKIYLLRNKKLKPIDNDIKAN